MEPRSTFSSGCWYHVRTVQELLGHKNLETTMVYADVANRDISRVTSPLDD